MQKTNLSNKLKLYLIEIPVGTKFYRKGKESPYWKETMVNQTTRKVTCRYLLKKRQWGILRRYIAYVHLNMYTEVYIDNPLSTNSYEQ